MIQLTHLGRRTRWDKGDWLPAVSPSHAREAAHRAFPKQLEDWDIARIVGDFADAAERMQAGGMDGIEIEAYGHLTDQFWSPLTNTLEAPYGGRWRTGCASPSRCWRRCGRGWGRVLSSGCAIPATRGWRAGSPGLTDWRFRAG